jgi:3-deoxy-7-phosphoheptulonate synthase
VPYHVECGDLLTVEPIVMLASHTALRPIPASDPPMRCGEPYRLASATANQRNRTVVDIRGRRIGGPDFITIAGPCAVESREFLLSTARLVADAGADLLRGGAWKPRTSPYSFQGMGYMALDLLREAREATGLPVVTEVSDARDLEAVVGVADVVQIGARNMQNYTLLREAGRAGIPVLLKRGIAATLEELLLAAEYVLAEGNQDVILCERGIRTFERTYRFTLDVSAVPVLKELSHLPVIVDPSHAAGRRELVLPLSLAAAAAGADGIIVEVHAEPERALCDGRQALRASEFADYHRLVGQTAALVRTGHYHARNK